jgi:pimeloyl-ACP methyl ester carboxylesterase
MTTVDNPRVRASVQVNGRRISYLEWGAAPQPALVLLHGGNSAAADWETVAAAFADRFRVLAPDLRGRGFSDWDPSKDYTVAVTMADLEAWRAQLGLDHIVLAGHSFGAVVGLGYAARYPLHVERLVLLDGGPVPDRSPAERAARMPALAQIPLEFASWQAALEWQRARNPAIVDEFHLQLAQNHFARQPDGSVTWRSDLRGQVKWSREGDPLMADQWPFVRALECPTLVIRGGSSPLFGADIARRMVETNSRVSVVEIPGAGHSVHHEKPAEVIAAMRQFLSA